MSYVDADNVRPRGFHHNFGASRFIASKRHETGRAKKNGTRIGLLATVLAWLTAFTFAFAFAWLR